MSGRILVVDDVATNRIVLKAKLASAYFEVIQAASGTEALERARNDQPDLVLLDVMMPDMTGFEVCRRLKADPATTCIPVIMVTALFEPEDRLKGLESGADDFITKPINDLALFARVRNLLRAKLMMDELRLRDRTAREFGLAPMPGEGAEAVMNGPPGQVVMVPRDERQGATWRQAVARCDAIDARVMTDERQVMALDEDAVPEVYLINDRLRDGADGLRLVSWLRSRPRTRNAAIVLVLPEGDQQRAAKGLDLGASDYIFDPFDPSELIVRLKSQIRRTRVAQQLRANVADTLRMAVLDPLTGLYNRRYAQQHLARIAARARETGKSYALMVLDIDRFKRINDSWGHAAGDSVLKEFARRIQENLRGVDLVSRLGGEEFLVAMPETSPEQARIAAERLRRVIEETPFDVPEADQPLPITVSIGVTLGAPETEDMNALIRQADAALYESKNEGRNMVTLYQEAA